MDNPGGKQRGFCELILSTLLFLKQKKGFGEKLHNQIENQTQLQSNQSVEVAS